jgi:hypothetical protein
MQDTTPTQPPFTLRGEKATEADKRSAEMKLRNSFPPEIVFPIIGRK